MTSPSESAPTPFQVAARHPLNLTLIGALGLSALLTGSVWPVLIGVVAELGWLALGPGLDSTRRMAQTLAAAEETRTAIGREQKLLRQTSEADRRRFLALDQMRTEIRKLVESHDSLSLEMMVGELHKVDRLLMAFLRVAAMTNAKTRVLAEADPEALERERDEAPEADPDRRALLAERVEQARKLEAEVEESKKQLDRVEAQLQLVRDRVATMTRPEDLGALVDDLVMTVEVVAEAGKETEDLSRGLLAARATRLTQ